MYKTCTDYFHSPLADGMTLHSSFSISKEMLSLFYSTWPSSHFKWLLAGMKGCISDAHADAAGYATHVSVLEGTKLWFLGLNPEDPGPDRRLGYDTCKTWYPLWMPKGSEL